MQKAALVMEVCALHTRCKNKRMSNKISNLVIRMKQSELSEIDKKRDKLIEEYRKIKSKDYYYQKSSEKIDKTIENKEKKYRITLKSHEKISLKLRILDEPKLVMQEYSFKYIKAKKQLEEKKLKQKQQEEKEAKDKQQKNKIQPTSMANAHSTPTRTTEKKPPEKPETEDTIQPRIPTKKMKPIITNTEEKNKQNELKRMFK